MLNNKSPGLTKKIYETFWKEIEIPFCNCIKKTISKWKTKYMTKTSCNKTYREKDQNKKIV